MPEPTRTEKLVTLDLGNGLQVSATAEAWIGAIVASLSREQRTLACALATQAMKAPRGGLVGGGVEVHVDLALPGQKRGL